MIDILTGDSAILLKEIPSQEFDCVVTSPPYNLGVNYHSYEDTLPEIEYLDSLSNVFTELRRVLTDDGHVFLNIGFSSKNPILSFQVLERALEHFRLQNRIMWVKSIAINNHVFGHYRPLNSNRYLNSNYEELFHLTPKGDSNIDRLAIGVPYTDTSNIQRFKKKNTNHCRGNVWFVPYNTTLDATDNFAHPATFPSELVRNCLLVSRARRVLDPYCGTGTTLIATKALSLDGLGIEIDPRYADIAKQRLTSEVSYSNKHDDSLIKFKRIF